MKALKNAINISLPRKVLRLCENRVYLEGEAHAAAR